MLGGLLWSKGDKAMDTVFRKLDGANMDIDLATPAGRIGWQQDKCPWNEAGGLMNTNVR